MIKISFLPQYCYIFTLKYLFITVAERITCFTMKICTLILLSLWGTLVLNGQQKAFLENVYDYIEKPEIFELNQEAGHTPLNYYNNLADALKRAPKDLHNYQLLNGIWKFNLSENPDLAPKTFFDTTFDASSWNEIQVPSNWQMQGYGYPVFRNISHPFPANPPFVPKDYNPVGSYIRTFQIPDTWKGDQIFLRFEGISSASFVWVNGKQVGFNEGAMEPSEYNITRFVHPGSNTLAVQVFQFSAGTYLEDQDMWRLSGIFRDVKLYASPSVSIRDFQVFTELDNTYSNANLKVKTEIRNFSTSAARGYKVRISLFDCDGNTVVYPSIFNAPTIQANDNAIIEPMAVVNNPAKWSAEKPYLYTLLLELIQPNGNLAHVLSQKVGFRSVEVKHQALLVNGQHVKLNGVNSHMQHPISGHAMDTATIRKDLTLMKQFNINCVRTSHYPPNIEYLDMADELGIYIVDETGDESHATEYISEDPEWKAAYIERVQKLVLRDRNHPSVIIWSAGNESGFGNNICEVIKEGKRLDPTRPAWMYGGNTIDFPGKNPMPCEDIIGPRYPTPFELKTLVAEIPESADPRPSFMDEYLAATGNAIGGMDEFWDVIWNYPRTIGGAIWDFVSPGLKTKHIATPDSSPNNINTALMGKATLVEGRAGKAISLSGHDEWVELYRDPVLDITGNQITLSLWVKPGKWNGTGTFLTKGSNQFGLQQINNDSVEFYFTGKERSSLKSLVPENWEENWHHLAGIYDGKMMRIYVDGMVTAMKPCNQYFSNWPFQVNIGRNAEIHGQEHPGYLSNAIFDQVSIFNKAIPVEKLIHPTSDLKKQALLWLDFDATEEQGEFFSMGIGGRTYGMVWPDRTPQPELWQVKKSGQPVKFVLTDGDSSLVTITNRFRFTNLNEYDITWKLLADSSIISKGSLMVDLGPMQSKQVKIPVSKPRLTPGKEYRIDLSVALRKTTAWASRGFEIAWDQLELPWNEPASKQTTLSGVTPQIINSQKTLTVKVENIECSFSKQTGNLTSLKIKDKEMIEQGPVMNVWRASIANELDEWTVGSSNTFNRKPGMGNDVANAWRSSGLDRLVFKLDTLHFSINKNGSISVVVENHAQANDYSTAFENAFMYTIYPSGEINIAHTVTPWGILPAWIPKIGTQWTLSKDVNQISWYGRGPQENYPDRKTGMRIGIYSSTVEKEYQPYLITQDYGNKCDTRWVRFTDSTGKGLEISGSHLFNFSAQEYSTDNLTRALYPFQLLPFNGITFNLDYATSGVGCTAISVLNKYRVTPQEYTFTTKLKPVF